MQRLFTSLSVGLDALRANRLRTALSTLGVVIGVAAVVAILSVGDGVERLARENVGSTTSLQTVLISPLTERHVDGHRLANSDWPRFDGADLDSLKRRLPAGCLAAMTVEGTAVITDAAGDERALSLVGQTGHLDLGDRLRHGRAMTAAERHGTEPLMVAGGSLARALGDSTDSGLLVGTVVTLNGTDYTVVGVAESTNRHRLRALVPLATAEAGFVPRPQPRPCSITIEAPTVEAVTQVETATQAWLIAREGDSWSDRVQVSLNRYRLEQMQQAFLIFKLLMGSIAGISLITGGIGIMNVLLAGVAERTREIGVRKAMGARRGDIMVQFLGEAVAVTCLGCLLGLALGLSAAFGITAIMRAQTEAVVAAAFTWQTAALALGLALMVGLGFGIYPALRASRLSPIDAIRQD